MTLDPQTIVILVLSLINLVGLGWAIARERYFVRMTTQQTAAMMAIEKTIDQGTIAIRLGFKSIRRKIEASDSLTSEKRREMLSQIDASERRTMEALQTSIQNLCLALQLQGIHTGVTIQGDNATVAQGQDVKQQRKG